MSVTRGRKVAFAGPSVNDPDDDRFYDGLVFHRVIPGCVAQGGGFDIDLVLRTPRDPIVNEANNGLRNLRGTIAMARSNDPDSATSQFFVNVADNPALDFKAKTASKWGYAVFGRVTEGMDVIDAMVAVPTGPSGIFDKDVPTVPIVITRARRR
jgi:cyclophilin family peptidyl-prolyl cis-trans isomerase